MRGRLSALVRPKAVTKYGRHLFGCCAAAVAVAAAAAAAWWWWVRAHRLVQSSTVALIGSLVGQQHQVVHTDKGNQFFLLFPCIRTRTHTDTFPRRFLNLFACTHSHINTSICIYVDEAFDSTVQSEKRTRFLSFSGRRPPSGTKEQLRRRWLGAVLVIINVITVWFHYIHFLIRFISFIPPFICVCLLACGERFDAQHHLLLQFFRFLSVSFCFNKWPSGRSLPLRSNHLTSTATQGQTLRCVMPRVAFQRCT